MIAEPHTGITRIETLGSIWMIDNDLRRYCRFPKHEGPRERPDWSDERAGLLQDAIWHDFAGEWFIDPYDRLVIPVEEHESRGWYVIQAPLAEIFTT